MSCCNRMPVALLIVIAFLSPICLARNIASAEHPQNAAPANDEAALRILSERFFAAYAKNDVEGCMQLWSGKSPDLSASRKEFQQTFAASKIALKRLTIRKISAENGQATVRVVADINVSDAKTGKPVAGSGITNRTLHFVKEGDEWKVWQYASSEQEMAAALALMKTNAERKAGLETEKELVTVELVRGLLKQGFRLINQGKYQAALDILQLTLDVANRLEDRKGIASALEGIGGIHFYQGHLTQALEYYQRCLKIREEAGDKSGIASVLSNIGNVYSSQDSDTQALEYYQKSLAIAEEIGDKPEIASALNNIGIIYAAQFSDTQALEAYQRSLTIAEEIGDKEAIAGTLINIGRVHDWQGNYSQALEYHQKSLQVLEEVGNQYVIVRALNNIGHVYRLQGNYTQALEYHQKSLTIAEEIGDQGAIASVLDNIGTVYRLQNNYEQALVYYQRGLKIAEKVGNQERPTLTLNNIGTIYRLQGDYTQALAYYQESLAISEKAGDKYGVALTLNNIGNVYLSQGNYAQALEYFQKNLKISEEVGDKFGIAFTLNNIGSVYNSQGNPAQAIEMASRAASIAEQIGSLDVLWRARTTAGKAYLALNHPDQARLAFDLAITVVEELRTQIAGAEPDRQRFFEDKLSSYHQMVQLLIGQHNLGEALGYAERAKARVLLDVLRSGRVKVTKAMSRDELEIEQRLNDRYVSLHNQIARAAARPHPDTSRLTDLQAQLLKSRLAREAFQSTLFASHPQLRLKRGQAQTLTLTDAAALLPDSASALLEFVVTDDQTFLFVLTKRSSAQPSPDLKAYPIDIKQKDLAARAERFRQQLASHDLDFQQPATRLYDLLLRPAQAQLAGKTNLVIIPDDALWQLPFQALQPAPDRYLLEDAAIAYAPSLTVLGEMMRLRQTTNHSAARGLSLLAVGNPALGKGQAERVRLGRPDQRLDPLPEAEAEVKSVARLYGPERSRVYLEAEAKEERIKAEAGSYDVLHLATHAMLNDASPMYSHIVLSQGEGGKEDGLLEAWEMMRLDLQAELVVLSACETARGRVGAGEGVIGMMWAVFVAGCRTTVVSQWKVESAATTELMVEFHRNLKRGAGQGQAGPTKAEALREAALRLMKQSKYRHPLYWAAFILVGDGR